MGTLAFGNAFENNSSGVIYVSGLNWVLLGVIVNDNRGAKVINAGDCMADTIRVISARRMVFIGKFRLKPIVDVVV